MSSISSNKVNAMSKLRPRATVLGGVLSFQPWNQTGARAGASSEVPIELAPGKPGRSYLVQVHSAARSPVVEAVMPMLDRLLSEKTAEVRKQKLEELVDFITSQMVVPSAVDVRMAQRIAARHARVLNEFGYVTAEQLADANQSRAANRNARADNWKKRRQVFAVRHRDESGRPREVFPLFQFEDHKPIKAVQAVLEALGEHKAPWKLALWFTSNNGCLPGQGRPVDLLESAPEAVVQAAQHDAAPSAT
jgi:hypothetical protein